MENLIKYHMHAVSKKVCLEEKTLSSNHKTIGFFIDRFKTNLDLIGKFTTKEYQSLQY